MPKFCAVYGCANRSNREKKKSYFRVPKVVTHKGENFKNLTQKRRQTWIKNLNLKSKGAESDNARVCSDHFVKGYPSAVTDEDSEDWAPTVCLGYQREKPMTEASLQGSQAREPVCLHAAVQDDTQERPVPEETTSTASAVAKDHDYACRPSSGKLDSATRRVKELELQVLSLGTEIKQLTYEKQQPLIFKFCTTDEDFRFYTRFSSKEVFNGFWESVHPSASKLAHWSEAQQMKQETCSPQQKLLLIDEFFMFLCRVAAGIQEKTLSAIFDVSSSTVSRIILTWTSYLYLILGSLPVWMTKQQVQAMMPMKFKLSCPHVRVIIKCAEVRCETASSLSPQSDTLPKNKKQTTFKGLIGIAPCGVITFVSKLYTGYISDTEITRRSHILQLLEPGDGVIVSKGSLIERMLSEVGATLITPPLEKSTQLTDENTCMMQTAVSRLRILVERAIRRVKEYRVWDGLVPSSLAGSVNELWVVCCLMSNYQGPLDPFLG